MKQGEGPGELTRILNCVASLDRLFVVGVPPKILTYDHDGRLLKEVSLSKISQDFYYLISYNAGNFYFERLGRPAGQGWTDWPQGILAVSENGQESRLIASFPIRAFVTREAGGAMGMTTYNHLIAVPCSDGRFIISHTPDYLLKVCDAETGRITKEFRRAYKRVPMPRGTFGGVSGPVGTSPELPNYMNDIQNLHFSDGLILIQTSTVDETKGPLIDVFDLDGRYVDCYYLKLSDKKMDAWTSNRRLVFAGGAIYVVENTEDGLVLIRKCRPQ